MCIEQQVEYMKKKIKISLFLSVYIFIISGMIVYAHSGRTDANGGHWDRSTGTYHYHTGEYTGRSHSPTPTLLPAKKSKQGIVGKGIIGMIAVSFGYSLIQTYHSDRIDNNKADIIELDQRSRDNAIDVIRKINEYEKYLSVKFSDNERAKYVHTLNEYNKLIEQIPKTIQEMTINCAVYDTCIDRVHFNKNRLHSLKVCRENQAKAVQELRNIHQKSLKNSESFKKYAFPKRILAIKHICSKCGETLRVRYYAAEGQSEIPKMSIVCPYCCSYEIIIPQETI